MQTHKAGRLIQGETCASVSGLLKKLKPEYQQTSDGGLQERSLAELAGLAQIIEDIRGCSRPS